MTIAYYTNVLSPHQLPLAREIVRLVGDDNYHYVFRDEPDQERLSLGWGDQDLPRWCMRGGEDSPELVSADLVYTGGLRPLGLLARRIAAGKKTFYVTERWFKPIRLFGINFPGTWRLLVPSYRKMARRMVELLNNPLCRCLTIGPWSRKDMLRLGVKAGQIWEWGYFVEEGRGKREEGRGKWEEGRGKREEGSGKKEEGRGKREEGRGKKGEGRGKREEAALRILWVGRIVGLKRVDTIITAVKALISGGERQIELDVYGSGMAESRLKKMARGYEEIVKFHSPVSIYEVREIMREHDVYVFASDANEGWGAVVNEALAEGMKVLGTYEAGASAAMLPDDDLFHSGDWRRLKELLARCAKEKRDGKLVGQGIGEWTPEKAAQRLVGALA